VWGIIRADGVDTDNQYYVDKMNLMTKEQSREFAKKVYKKNYWDPFKLDTWPDQQKAFMVFSSAVNPGAGFVGRALKELGQNWPVEAFLLKKCRFYINRCLGDPAKNCNVLNQCRCITLMKDANEICYFGDRDSKPSSAYLHSLWMALDKCNKIKMIVCPEGHVCHSIKYLVGWLNGCRDQSPKV
jgi:hypothetical protein